jgi:hypothetical protein
MPNPVILIPGIKGTELINTFKVSHDATWAEFDLLYEDPYQLVLDPTGRVDAHPRIVTRPGRLFPFIYEEIVLHLEKKLKVPVYPFAYDWRMSNRANGRRLLAFVDELRAKPGNTRSTPFDVVCHSMGGLILRSAATQASRAAGTTFPFERVAFLGTPHNGALDAAFALIRGDGLKFQHRRALREAARTMPAVYDLLPAYDGAVTKDGNPRDIFNPRHWPEDVVAESQPYPLSPSHLRQAKLLHDKGKSGLARFAPHNVLQIYGVADGSTLASVVVVPNKRKSLQNSFDFEHATMGDGDGVVLARESAVVPGYPSVRVRNRDTSFLGEYAEKGWSVVLPLHVILPRLDVVGETVERFLRGETGDRVLSRRLPKHRYSAG